MKNYLIAVDVQKDFCENGSLAVAGGNNAAVQIAEYIGNTEEVYDKVVATKDWHVDPEDHFASNLGEDPDYVNTWPDHCVAFTNGAKFNVAVRQGEHFDEVFYKGMDTAAYSGFEGFAFVEQGTDPEWPTFEDFGLLTLEKYLGNPKIEQIKVDVVGIAYDYCVKATALDAARLGYDVRVIKGLTASVAPDNDAQTTKDLQAAGVEVVDAA